MSVMEISPFGRFGAEIRGLDLNRPIGEPAVAEIWQALVEHHIVCLRGQSLNPDQVVEFSARLGPLEAHVMSQYHHPETPLIVVLSNRYETGKAVGLKDAGTFWHSDVSYKAKPARATLLYSVEVPDTGGDTLFCDLTAAWAEMPVALKARIETRRAEHDYAKRNRIAAAQGTTQALTAAQIDATPPVLHPTVITIPDSGQQALYMNPAYTTRIDGYDAAESEALMAEVFDFCLQDRFRLRYRWCRGDVVFWDNRAVMHSATTHDLPADKLRTMWRTIILDRS